MLYFWSIRHGTHARNRILLITTCNDVYDQCYWKTLVYKIVWKKPARLALGMPCLHLLSHDLRYLVSVFFPVRVKTSATTARLKKLARLQIFIVLSGRRNRSRSSSLGLPKESLAWRVQYRAEVLFFRGTRRLDPDASLAVCRLSIHSKISVEKMYSSGDLHFLVNILPQKQPLLLGRGWRKAIWPVLSSLRASIMWHAPRATLLTANLPARFNLLTAVRACMLKTRMGANFDSANR